jgi:hypothetical protein
MTAVGRAALVIIIAVIALFIIEGIAIASGQPTISEGMQRLTAQMGEQVLAGLSFLAGAVTGWFVAHFASTPPGGS